jgi:hypothetical protein
MRVVGALALALALTAVLVTVMAVIGFRLLADDSDSPKDTEPNRIRVIVASRLTSGTRFNVGYEAKDPADADRLRPPVALELRRRDKTINTLITDLNGRPRVRPAGAVAIEAVDLRGPGPFEFTLPKLDDGRFQLCGAVWLDTGSSRERELFCRTIRVVR